MKWFLLLFITTSTLAQTKIIGAGATFPYPLYSKWIQEFQAKHPGVEVNYQPIGSGGGVKQLSMELVDFGASDVQLTPQEKKLFKTDVLEVPMTIGGIVLAYKLAGVPDLKLSRAALDGIFTGKIVRWNHETIQKDNPGAKLPPAFIKVIVRADASGTTAGFTEFLTMLSPEFKLKVGAGKAVQWPLMVARGKGNDGVTALLQATEGSIGYVEMAYAINQKLPMATLENKSGKWITPSLASFTHAASTAKPGQYQILDSTQPKAWPITSFSFILLPKKGRTEKTQQEVKSFIIWGLTEGQKLSASLHYSPLPQALSSVLKSSVEKY